MIYNSDTIYEPDRMQVDWSNNAEMKEKNEPMVGLVLKEKVLENPLTHPQCVYVELRWSKFLVSSSSVLLCYQLLYGTLGWQMVFDLQTRLGKTLTVLWISDKYVLFKRKKKKIRKTFDSNIFNFYIF